MEVVIRENFINISELGLDLQIKPERLIHQMMDNDGRSMLNAMLAEKLDGILIQLVHDYAHIESTATEETKQSIKDGTKVIKSLQDYAIFVRQIVPICFSFEIDFYLENKSKDIKSAVDWAYSIMKYNPAYGYKKGSKTEIKL